MYRYNRYNDISKFITDENELKIINEEVCISEYYDITLDLEETDYRFADIKSFIIIISKNLYILDNIVQNFVDLYLDSMDSFPYDLQIFYITKKLYIHLIYWGEYINNEIEVIFEYNNNNFILKKFGSVENVVYN